MAEMKAFNIFMPEELYPLYNFLQSELTAILSDKALRAQLATVDLSLARGKVWLKIKSLFLKARTETPAWSVVHNKAWHANILAENLRRELESKRQNTEIFNLLKVHNFKITEQLREDLVSAGLYPTNGLLQNLIDSGKVPELARDATFVLDYSISEKQFFRIDPVNPHQFYIKVGSTDWIGYRIDIPVADKVGRIARPRFIKRGSDGRYIGVCSYEYQPPKAVSRGRAVLGVDLGKVKTYSACAVNSRGENSGEFLPSRSLERLNKKEQVLLQERSFIYRKIEQHEALGVPSSEKLLEQKRGISSKISRLKEKRAELIAAELLYLCKEHSCAVLALEKLSWLKSRGGKWEHSLIQQKIEEKARQNSIKIKKVNPAYSSSKHPLTGEAGYLKGREVHFSDGSSLDRDLLAAINIANRAAVYTLKTLKKRKVKKTKRSPAPKNKNHMLQKGAGLVVPVSPSVVHFPDPKPVKKGETARSTKITVVRSYSSLLDKYYKE